MVEAGSISSDPSLVPWGGVEAGRSWVCCPESRCTESRTGRGAEVGGSGGDLNHIVLAALDTRGDEAGERRYKGESEKRENSSRAQRGCGLACGFNQLHKECEKYQEFGSGVGTPWYSVSLSLWSNANESGERHRTCPSFFCQLLLARPRMPTSSLMSWDIKENLWGCWETGF